MNSETKSLFSLLCHPFQRIRKELIGAGILKYPVSFQVDVSNKQCLKKGGPSCRLNYEMQSGHVIRVKTTDDGTPQLSFERDLRIDLRDINDKPRDLQLSNNLVKENATTTSPFGR